jgi:hypothetical protein
VLDILRDPNEVTDPNDPDQLWGAADVDLVNLPRSSGSDIRVARVLNNLAADGDVIADQVGVFPRTATGLSLVETFSTTFTLPICARALSATRCKT